MHVFQPTIYSYDALDKTVLVPKAALLGVLYNAFYENFILLNLTNTGKKITYVHKHKPGYISVIVGLCISE